MRSIHRTALLRSTLDDNNHDDDDPSPAGGAMPVPAILSANDNATVEPLRLVEPHKARTPDVHPDLLACTERPTDSVVGRRCLAIIGGEPVNDVALLDGKIISVAGEIEALALSRLGRRIETINVPHLSTHTERRSFILRSFPPEGYDDVTRAVAFYLATTKEEREEFSRSLEVEGGRRGAAIRHHGAPKGPEVASASYPKWVMHYATEAGVRHPDAIRKVFRLGDNAPEMFELVRTCECAYVDDALQCFKRYPKSAEHQVGLFRAWQAARVGDPSKAIRPRRDIRLVDFVADYARMIRKDLDDAPIRTPQDVVDKAKGVTLLWGRMEERGQEVESGSIDIVFADVLYDSKNLVPMSRMVARYASRVLDAHGSFILCCGNFRTREAINAVMAEANGAFEEPLVLTVFYEGAKLGKSVQGVNKIDSIPFFLFRRASQGATTTRIAHLHYVSDAQNGGDPIHSDWEKNAKVLAAMFEALNPTRDKLRISDPCMGWGSAGRAAVRLGYEFVGIEMSNENNRYNVAVESILAAEKGVWPKPIDPKTVKSKTDNSDK